MLPSITTGSQWLLGPFLPIVLHFVSFRATARECVRERDRERERERERESGYSWEVISPGTDTTSRLSEGKFENSSNAGRSSVSATSELCPAERAGG
jgi:hypothetical protein